MKEIIRKLNEASDAYYNTGHPIMTDAEWDRLFDKLKEMETETGIIMAGSPTQKVGYEVKSSLSKVNHTVPMLSLDKTKSVDDLNKFKGNHVVLLSLKLDGLSCRLTYKNGNLWRAETRGNGEIGEDITHNAMVIENIPKVINKADFPAYYEIDGEIIITYDDFEKINANLSDEEKYKNPRNLASGSIRQLDSKIAASRCMRFVAWKVITNDGDSYADRLVYASTYGFTIVPYRVYDSDEIIDDYEINELKEIATENHSYPIDGLVAAYDDIKYGDSLGRTGHHFKSGLAFKFGEEEADTILRNIEWSMGTTGELTPVAVFDPVELSGTEVSRASIHNISIMGDLYRGTWYEGLKLTVIKANEIIPQIISVEDGDRIDGKHCYIPAFCPVCGSPTEIRQDNNSKVLVCTNANCSGKKLGKFVQYCSKDAMDIKGLSEATLRLMLDRGIISEYRDLYFLNMAKNRLSQLPGMGARSVNNLIKAIEKSSHTTLDRFLVALSIPNIGRSAAKAIVKHCDSVDDFFDKWKSIYRWSNIPDFGEVMEKSLNIFGVNNRAMIEDLIGVIDIEEFKTEISGENPLDGMSFVITGSVDHFKNRNELKARIEQLGGKVVGSVSKKTFYLINNDKESSSSKNKKAKDLGIPIISEEDFLVLINNAN